MKCSRLCRSFMYLIMISITMGLLMFQGNAEAQSCEGRCGNYDPAITCQCDDLCSDPQYNDCCPDKDIVCQPQASCAGYCGQQSLDGCWCDDYCTTANDCCQDYESECQAPAVSCECFTKSDIVNYYQIQCSDPEKCYLLSKIQQIGSPKRYNYSMAIAHESYLLDPEWGHSFLAGKYAHQSCATCTPEPRYVCVSPPSVVGVNIDKQTFDECVKEIKSAIDEIAGFFIH